MRRRCRIPRAKLFRVNYGNKHEVFMDREDADEFARKVKGKVKPHDEA